GVGAPPGVEAGGGSGGCGLFDRALGPDVGPPQTPPPPVVRVPATVPILYTSAGRKTVRGLGAEQNPRCTATSPGHPSGTRQGAPARRQRVVDVARGCVPMDELLSEFAPREGGEDALVTGPRCRLGV